MIVSYEYKKDDKWYFGKSSEESIKKVSFPSSAFVSGFWLDEGIPCEILVNPEKYFLKFYLICRGKAENEDDITIIKLLKFCPPIYFTLKVPAQQCPPDSGAELYIKASEPVTISVEDLQLPNEKIAITGNVTCVRRPEDIVCSKDTMSECIDSEVGTFLSKGREITWTAPPLSGYQNYVGFSPCPPPDPIEPPFYPCISSNNHWELVKETVVCQYTLAIRVESLESQCGGIGERQLVINVYKEIDVCTCVD